MRTMLFCEQEELIQHLFISCMFALAWGMIHIAIYLCDCLRLPSYKSTFRTGWWGPMWKRVSYYEQFGITIITSVYNRRNLSIFFQVIFFRGLAGYLLIYMMDPYMMLFIMCGESDIY